jgi:hypothetical protein
MKSNPLFKATAVGTILQVLMVLIGHASPAVAQMFAVGGTGISGVAGLLYALWNKSASGGAAASGGAVAGVVSALLGIMVSNQLGDVPASTFGIGGVSGVAAGAIGGLIGKMLGGRARA